MFANALFLLDQHARIHAGDVRMLAEYRPKRKPYKGQLRVKRLKFRRVPRHLERIR